MEGVKPPWLQFDGMASPAAAAGLILRQLTANRSSSHALFAQAGMPARIEIEGFLVYNEHVLELRCMK